MKIKNRLYQIVFYSNTKAGKIFDLILLWTILLSVLTVIIDSIPSFGQKYLIFFRTAEWLFTILFTLEYILRIIISPKPYRYVFSFSSISSLTLDCRKCLPFKCRYGMMLRLSRVYIPVYSTLVGLKGVIYAMQNSSGSGKMFRLSGM